MSNRKLFHGTMNASKTAQLLMQVYNLERQGKSFVIFKPALDTRDIGVAKSRALDEERPAILVYEKDDWKMYKHVFHNKPDFVFVDELQFMTPEQVKELATISIDLNTPIFAYGLLISYNGKLFAGSKQAIECGFTMHELRMQCDYCTEKSTNHLLFVDGFLVTDGDGIHVGDEEYKSVCYTCYANECNK